MGRQVRLFVVTVDHDRVLDQAHINRLHRQSLGLFGSGLAFPGGAFIQ